MRGSSQFCLATRKSVKAFTLIELLIVVAIIGIMSALIMAAVTNSAEDTRLVLVRQQQAVVQEAVNAWVAANTATGSVSAVRSQYNAAPDRFALVTAYLDPTTVEHFADATVTNSQHRSEAMAKSGKYLVFAEWGTNSGSYPRVNVGP